MVCSITPENRRETLSATELNPELNVWQGLLVEVWLTFILVSTIHGATNSKRKGNLYMPTIIIGCAVTVGVMSGVSNNYFNHILINCRKTTNNFIIIVLQFDNTCPLDKKFET